MRSLSRRDLIRFASAEDDKLALELTLALALALLAEEPAKRRLSKYSLGFDAVDAGVDLECCANGARLHESLFFV